MSSSNIGMSPSGIEPHATQAAPCVKPAVSSDIAAAVVQRILPDATKLEPPALPINSQHHVAALKQPDFQATPPSNLKNTEPLEVKKLTAADSQKINIALSLNNKQAIKALLQKGVRVELWSDPKTGQTVLHSLCKEEGNDELIALLLKNKPDLQARDQEGNTPLTEAGKNGCTRYFSLLVEHGANASEIDTFEPDVRNEFFSYASMSGKLEKLLGKVTIPQDVMNSHLAFMVWAGNAESVRLLVQHGADLNPTTTEPPLLTALNHPLVNENLVKTLIELGAEVKTPGANHLLRAVEINNKKIFEMLLAKGAPVPQDPESLRKIQIFAMKHDLFKLLPENLKPTKEALNGLLAFAVETQDLTAVKALVKKDATYEANLDGAFLKNPIDHKMVDIQLFLKADVNMPLANGKTPLAVAAKRNDALLFRKLLQAGAKLDGAEAEKFVSHAVGKKNIDLLSAVISHPACILDKETKDDCLRFACEMGHTGLMKELIQKGADPHSIDAQSEKNILHLAVERWINADDFEVLLFICEDLKLAEHATLFNQKDSDGNTPLTAALVGASNDAFKYLADKAQSCGSLKDQGFALFAQAVDFKLSEKIDLLKSVGIDSNVKNGEGRSLLQCVMDKDTYDGDTLERLVDLKADLTVRNKAGESLFDIVRKNHDSYFLLRLITDHDIPLTEDEVDELTNCAAKSQNVGALRLLIQKYEATPHYVNPVMQQGLLHLAMPTAELGMMQFLIGELKLEKQIHMGDEFAPSPLEEALESGREDIITYLTQNSDATILKDNPGLATKLFISALEGKNFPLLKTLIVDKGLSLPPSTSIFTCMSWAASKGDLEVLKTLAKMYPDEVSDVSTASNYYGMNLAHIAARDGNLEVLRYVMKDLGLSIDTPTKTDEKTALHFACAEGNREAVNYLLTLDPDLEIKDAHGQTLLHAAAASKSTELVAMLLATKKFSPNEADESGITPLHLAAEYGTRASVEALLKNGAKIDQADFSGRTAFERAQNRGNVETIPALHELGKIPLLPLTEEAMPKLLKALQACKEVNPKERISFHTFLEQRGFSAVFQNIDLHKLVTDENHTLSAAIFKNVNFSGITFDSCNLSSVNFSGATFTNCEFRGACNLQECVFLESKFYDNCRFVEANMTDSLFEKATFENVTFSQCNLSYVGINGSEKASNLVIDSCVMHGANFLGSKVQNSQFLRTNLENCLLFEAKQGFSYDKESEKNLGRITLPSVAIAWNTQSPGDFAKMSITSLKASEAIPLKFNYLPDEIKTEKLKTEVQDILNGIKRADCARSSIPQEMLARAKQNPEEAPQINALMKKAQLIKNHVDAVLLPGGDDVQPEFYGHPQAEATVTESDYRRSVYEFALIQQARNAGIPLMGICRGSQIGNIFYGGTLRQSVPDQKKEQVLSLTVASEGMGTIRGIAFGKDQNLEFKAASRHHQATQKVADNLEVVIDFEGIPKAMEAKQGLEWFIQSHPEYPHDVSPQNYDIITGFRQAANASRLKKEALRSPQFKLSEIPEKGDL